MAPDEVYLGGLTSEDLIVMGFPGNGIHVTNKRLILVRTKMRTFGTMLGSFAGSFGLAERSGKLSGDASEHKIRELEKKKYLDVQREDVVSIELRRSSRRTGFLRVVPKSVEPIDVAITAMRDFEILKELMTTFYPEVLTVV
jgi:hypothetical protein